MGVVLKNNPLRGMAYPVKRERIVPSMLYFYNNTILTKKSGFLTVLRAYSRPTLKVNQPYCKIFLA